MNKIRKKLFLFCLLCIFVLTGLTACGSEEGVKVNSANALARKLASDSAVKINVSKDIILEEPIVVNGEKEIVGSGKIVAAVEDSEEVYMITVANGGKLTVGGSVEIDAAGLMGAIHVQDGGSAIVQDKAVVMNASEVTANALIEGSFEVKGGTLKDAKGHNIYNKKETVISGGEIVGSGSKYAGVYNEATLTQTGGAISKAYNNVSNVSGSTFTFEGGTNTKSIRDGVFVAEGATLKATKKDATIEEAGARGILLHGKADIKVITVKGCGDTLIKVGKRGVLNLGNGILQEGNYHGVDNAGTMTMMGGNIQMNKNCGIVNTGTLKVTGGNISSNENKGILNKHEGTADVTSAMVTFTSNKIAIGNEDKAVFEFAKAKIMMSTMTNIYCYDGTINLHDASLNASTSNNVRVIEGTINMTNVEVKGNSQKSNASHHGIIMDGGVINAENVTISMTTGCGMRVKGGTFNGKNIVMHDINRTAVSMGPHDYLEQEGLVNITGLEVQSVNYNNVLNNGGGTIKITDAKLALAASNSVRAETDGRIEITNVTIPGHKEGSKNNIHGIYQEGGEIIAKNVTIQNTSGNAVRNKNGKFVGTNIKMNNIKGDTAIANSPLDDEHKDGIIEIDGLTIKNAFSKNITLDSGVTTIKNATLGATGGNNIKMQNNDATLYIYNVKVEGQIEEATASTHGIMVEGGNVFGENIEIYNTNANAIRCKLGKVDLKNVTMSNLGQAGISNGTMVKDGVELGVGEVKIDGLTITKAGTNNIAADAGTVTIKNGVLGVIETVNHSVKSEGTAVVDFENVEVLGVTEGGRYGIMAQGGNVILKDVTIDNVKNANAIHVNRANSKLVGTNVTVKNSNNAVYASKGEIEIENLITSEINNNNVLAEGESKITVVNSELNPTENGHNVKANAEGHITLKDVKLLGVKESSKHVVMAEGGDFVLENVEITDAKNAGIRINKVASSVEGKNVIIKDAIKAIDGNRGTVTIDGFTTENVKSNNLFVGDGSEDAEESEDKCVITIVNGDLCKTVSSHNVKTTINGKVVLKNTIVKGTESNDHYGIITENGSVAELTDVTIQDVLGTKGEGMTAIYSNHASNVITGKNITIQNCRVGIRASAGTIEVEDLTITDVISKNIHLPDGSTGTIKVDGGTLGQTEAHNVHVKGADSSATLIDVTIDASTSNYALITENGGDATLTDVTIKAAKSHAIYVNHADSKVTGKNVTIENAENGIYATSGVGVIDNLITSGIRNNNVLSVGGDITVKNSEINPSAAHNMKTTAGSITLKNVKLLGTTANDRDVLMAEGGEFILNDVEITGAKRHAIYANKSTSKVTGEKVTITGTAANNVLVTAGEVELTDVSLGKTGGHNVKTTGGIITLVDASVLGTTSNSHHVIMVEGGDIDLDKVEISGTTASAERAAIRINNASSEVTGKDVTITDCMFGVSADKGSVSITGLTSSAVKRNLNIYGGTHEIKDATLNTTAQNNVHMGAGTLTLNNVSVEGVTGETVSEKQEDGSYKDVDYRVGIYVGGATLNVENEVTVKNTNWQGVHNDGGTITGDKIVAKDTGNIALWNTAAGVVELGELVISGVKNGHGIKNEGENSTITVEKGDIGKSPSNNIYVSNGTVTLKDTTIRGTVANHGVLAQGGDVVLEKVTIENAAGAGIRVNKSSSEVKGTNVTITGCGEGISNTDGVVDMENVDTTGCTKGIWTNATLKLAGVVKSKIQLGVANEVTATKALAGSVFTLDWDEGKIPEDLVAIQFASAEDMQATKENSTITFGTNANAGYVPYFYGTQLLLNDKNNIQYTVKNFAELQEVMAEINTTTDINTATITVAGDITITELVTVKAGKTVRIQDDTTARTIKRGASYTKGDLFEVEAGATLSFGSSSDDNSNPTLKIDGGSKNETPVITEPDSSLIKNNGTLTIASGVQLANAKGSEDYCKALAIYAGTDSMTTFKGVMKSIVGQYSTSDGYGYGIAITVGKTQDFVIENAIIKDNYTPEIGIIRLEAGGKLTIKNSTFENNESVKEAGVISDSGNANNRLTIEGSTFKNNKTSGNGGTISLGCATKDNITITGTTFTKNTANAGAVINMLTGASVTLSDCTFTENVTTNKSTTDSNCGYGDIRLGGNHEKGGIYISGKMIVDIYMNQAGKVNVVGALTEGSNVVANWRKGKITGDSFVGINYASEEVMNASKEYISLSDNYNGTYVIKNVGTTGTLVKPTVVTSETELKDAITAIGEASDKTGFIKVTEKFTLSATVNIPEGVNVTILDDGTARTITRAKKDISLFEVKSGATLSFVSTSKDNANPTLTIDGGSASITNSKGAALIGVSGSVNVSQGVVLTNNQSTGNNQGFAIYSNAGSTTVFSGVVSNIVGTHSSVKGNVFVIKGAFTLEDAIVRDNVAVAGGVIRMQGGQLTAIDTVFENNSSKGNGGVFFADTSGSKMSFERCTFKGNSATGDGGAIHNFIANTEIINCKFENNTAGKNGGAIYSGGGVTITITGDGTDQSLFANNKANGEKTKASDDETYYGGGAICIGSGNLTVSGYKFTGNETKADGGAINNRGNSLIVNNCEFSANKAVKHTVDGYGGAIFMFQGTLTIDVDQTTVTKFDGNEATYGGAIYQRAGTITSHNAVFNENKGGWNGGALYHKKEVTLKDCHFTANTTASKGGAVCNEGGTLNANNCEFTGNISNDEGGAYRQAAQGVGTFTSCTFTNNIAKKTGGGAIKYHNKSLIIDGCIFSGNTATEGDANGHDIKLSTTTTKPTIKNSTFDESNVRDSAGKAGAYNDGGNNTLVTEE